jgi:muramoyltetrapeptide carboxypeptidase
VAPASPIDAGVLAAGESKIERAGFRCVHREDLTARRGFLAGGDARRASEFMAMVDDPEVDAILCARGGYGSQRIISRLDAARVRTAAKPLVGFSDITTLLLWQRRVAGLVGFHGPMLERGDALADEEVGALTGALMGSEPGTLVGEPGGGDAAEGRLVGGSLTLVAGSLATPWEVDTRGAILLLEEVNEAPYRIDRLLGQLSAADKLRRLAGLGVGSLEGCCNSNGCGPSARAVIEEWIGPLDVPMAFELPFGHARPNLPWPVGVRARIDGRSGELRILERGVRVP